MGGGSLRLNTKPSAYTASCSTSMKCLCRTADIPAAYVFTSSPSSCISHVESKTECELGASLTWSGWGSPTEIELSGWPHGCFENNGYLYWNKYASTVAVGYYSSSVCRTASSGGNYWP